MTIEFLFQVAGRIGMLVTLYLITANTYLGVDAPPKRGFSYIEIWLCGVQVPMLVAIVEYSYILFVLKFKSKILDNGKVGPKSPLSLQKMDMTGEIADFDVSTLEMHHNRMDRLFGITTLTFFMLFNVIYWYLGQSKV